MLPKDATLPLVSSLLTQLRLTPIRAIESSAWALATLAANGYFRAAEVSAVLLQPTHFELMIALIATKNERIRGNAFLMSFSLVCLRFFL